jgi:hypothetical protein
MNPGIGRIPLTVGVVIATVIAIALLGMLMGAVFGLISGSIAPDIFIDPGLSTVNGLQAARARAIVIGAFGGLLSGASLAAFAFVMQAVDRTAPPAQRPGQPDVAPTQP